MTKQGVPSEKKITQYQAIIIIIYIITQTPYPPLWLPKQSWRGTIWNRDYASEIVHYISWVYIKYSNLLCTLPFNPQVSPSIDLHDRHSTFFPPCLLSHLEPTRNHLYQIKVIKSIYTLIIHIPNYLPEGFPAPAKDKNKRKLYIHELEVKLSLRGCLSPWRVNVRIREEFLN